MAITNDTFTDALIPGILHFYNLGRQAVPDTRAEVYNIKQSNVPYEEYRGIGGVDGNPMEQYANTGRIGHASRNEGFKTRIENVAYPVKLTVKRETFVDLKYGKIREDSFGLGRMQADFIQEKAASHFKNAKTAILGDGKALLANDHPLGPNTTESGDNLFAAGAAAEWSKAREAMIGFKNDVGQLTSSAPNLLLVAQDLEDDALEYAESRFAITAGKGNAINPAFNRFQVLAWPRLTAGSWFMIDTGLAMEHLHWQTHTALEIRMRRPDSVTIEYELYIRFGSGISDWRWVAGYVP